MWGDRSGASARFRGGGGCGDAVRRDRLFRATWATSCFGDVTRINGAKNLKSKRNSPPHWETILTESLKCAFRPSRHCEERKRRSNPFFPRTAGWIASLRSQ